MKKVITSIFNHAIKKAEESNPINENDYIKDDLYYCGVCNEQKQHLVKFPEHMEREPMLVTVPCKCVRDREEKERLQRRQMRLDLDRPKYIKLGCDILTFDKDTDSNLKFKNIAQNYVCKWDEMHKKNYGLLLYGDPGTGKTFYASCIANAIYDKTFVSEEDGWGEAIGRVMLTNIVSVVRKLQSQEFKSSSEEFIKKAISFPLLLVLDDFWAERDTEYMDEQVYQIINARALAKKPLILTTNLDIEDIKNPKTTKEKRIFDRVLEMCVPIEMKGKSLRKKMAAERYSSANDLLGIKEG